MASKLKSQLIKEKKLVIYVFASLFGEKKYSLQSA